MYMARRVGDRRGVYATDHNHLDVPDTPTKLTVSASGLSDVTPALADEASDRLRPAGGEKDAGGTRQARE